MKYPHLAIAIGVVLLIAIFIPGVTAVEPLWTVTAPPGHQLSTVVVSADGSTIVAGGDQLIALSRDGRKLWSGWSGSILDISSDGRYLATSQVQTVRLFSRTGSLIWDQSLGVPVTDLSMTPDGSLIAASGSTTLRTFYNSGVGLGSNTTDAINHIRFSPARDQVVVTTSRQIQRYNLSLVPLWYDANSTQDFVAMSGDGTLIVTVTFNRARMYYASGALIWERSIPGGNTLSLAYSRDGSTIVIGRDDNTLQVLSRDGNLLWTAKEGNWVSSVGVSDDGSVIAAGTMDKNLYFYDRKGTLLGTFTAGTPIKSRSVSVSGDGSVIAAADATAVYGFSRSQFITPATGIPTVTGTMPATILVTTGAPVSQPATPVAIPRTTATPQSGLPGILCLLSIAAFCLYSVGKGR